jgi:hypothetical protein
VKPAGAPASADFLMLSPAGHTAATGDAAVLFSRTVAGLHVPLLLAVVGFAAGLWLTK